MPRRSSALSLTLTILLSLGAATASAKDVPPAETGTGGALLEALAHVPSTTAALESTVSYLDQAALVAARPGAAQPDSLAEALAALDAGDPAAELWLAALMGASSGDMELLTSLPQAAAWPETVGFELLDVERHLTFGEPPSDGAVLIGAFDPGAVAAAFAELGYTADAASERTRLCGAAGCDAGMAVDLAASDPGRPFGGRLGRSEPLAVSAREILVSADLATLEGMESATDGTAASLAEDPACRGLALAGDPEVTLTQATFLPGGMLGLGLGIYLNLTTSPEEASELVARLAEGFEPMPAAKTVAILDGATADEQVVSIALAFEDEADAAIAAEVLPRRLESLEAPSYGKTMAELLADRGVTSVTGSVVPGESGTLPVARIDLRAPLPGSDPDTGRPAASSPLYRLFVDMIYRRDLLWLVPVLPLE